MKMGSKASLREHRTGKGRKRSAQRFKPDGVGKVRSKRDESARVNLRAELRREVYG
jgi:hypothetical protein